MARENRTVHINARGVYYRELNDQIRQCIRAGAEEIFLDNINGQYYIGSGLRAKVKIIVNGVPGNDLGAFMDGPTIIIKENAQDNIGNTMNSGKIVVHGHAGDVLGYAMRGGKLLIKEEVGYRVGIHMKGYQSQVPSIVIGGCAGDFLGEYMAGGILVVLGIGQSEPGSCVGDYLGTGMHGGTIYVRDEVEISRCGKEVGIKKVMLAEEPELKEVVAEFCQEFALALEPFQQQYFAKVIPVSSRPYGRLYVY